MEELVRVKCWSVHDANQNSLRAASRKATIGSSRRAESVFFVESASPCGTPTQTKAHTLALDIYRLWQKHADASARKLSAHESLGQVRTLTIA
jgi:hypothetical protein